MDTNGSHPVPAEQRPRKRQKQSTGATDEMPIHPDLQSSPVFPPQAHLQPSARHSLDADGADYPRRRAIIACEVCRGRKTRCDGGKPKCRLCTDLGAECIYREPGQKLDAGDKMILEQLHRMEGLLSSLDPRYRSSDETSHAFAHGGHQNNDGDASNLFDALSKSSVSPELFAAPISAKDQLTVELRRSDFSLGSKATADLSKVGPNVENYFDRLSDWHSLVDSSTWQAVYATASLHSFSKGIESCTVLLIAALGELAVDQHLLAESTRPERTPGLDLFTRAWSLIPEVLIANNKSAIQSLILAAHYQLGIYRPLDAWNTLSIASTKLAFRLSSADDADATNLEHLKKLYWNIRLLKWNISSTVEVPAGVAELTRSPQLGLPNGSQTAPNGHELLAAQASLMRLMERVSAVLPPLSSNRYLNIDTLIPAALDLDSQLSTWHHNLPESLRFMQDVFPAAGPAQDALRLGFFACRAAIFRPFVFALIQLDPSQDMERDMLTPWCKRCLEGSVRQIEYTSVMNAARLPWKTANDIAAESLFVVAATLTPALAAMLPPLEHVKTRLVDHVVVELDRLSHLSPALAVKVAALREAEERSGMLSRAAAEAVAAVAAAAVEQS